MSSKALSFRKGRDDGDWRLGWRGNSGTSRHQPLLSVATHILFLSTTLSWGQCPCWRGQEVVPECYGREEQREHSNPTPSIDRPREESPPRKTLAREEGRMNPNLDGILLTYLGSSMNESQQAGGRRLTLRSQFGGVLDSGS